MLWRYPGKTDGSNARVLTKINSLSLAIALLPQETSGQPRRLVPFRVRQTAAANLIPRIYQAQDWGRASRGHLTEACKNMVRKQEPRTLSSLDVPARVRRLVLEGDVHLSPLLSTLHQPPGWRGEEQAMSDWTVGGAHDERNGEGGAQVRFGTIRNGTEKEPG